MKNWILEKLAGMFGPKYIGATIRTLLAALGGALAGVNGLPAGVVEKFITAADQLLNPLAVIAVTWAWSLIQKKLNSD